MMTDSTPPSQRVFRYDGQTFPDPGPAYTVEQVLTHLRGFFPELGQARTIEKRLPDGTLEITFRKRVTRKGASAALAAALAVLPPAEAADGQRLAEALGAAQPVTLQTIQQHSTLIHQYAVRTQKQTALIQQVGDAWQQLPAHPLPVLPPGF